jgi:hypothetical protein
VIASTFSWCGEPLTKLATGSCRCHSVVTRRRTNLGTVRFVGRAGIVQKMKYWLPRNTVFQLFISDSASSSRSGAILNQPALVRCRISWIDAGVRAGPRSNLGITCESTQPSTLRHARSGIARDSYIASYYHDSEPGYIIGQFLKRGEPSVGTTSVRTFGVFRV